MSAIFCFTFDIGRMTEVLTPDIYIELTTVPLIFSRPLFHLLRASLFSTPGEMDQVNQ